MSSRDEKKMVGSDYDGDDPTGIPTPQVEMLSMTNRSELAERIEVALQIEQMKTQRQARSPFGRGLSAADIELIIAALRAPALPSEEEIMSEPTQGQLEQLRDGIPALFSAEQAFMLGWQTKARAVLALCKTGGEK